MNQDAYEELSLLEDLDQNGTLEGEIENRVLTLVQREFRQANSSSQIVQQSQTCLQRSKLQQKQRQYEQELAKKVQTLYFEDNATISIIMQRLKIGYRKVKSFLKMAEVNQALLAAKVKRPYKKINASAKQLIESHTSSQSKSFSCIELKKLIQVQLNQNISVSLIRSYLKYSLKFKFRKQYYLSPRVNNIKSKLQRQVAAFYYVKNLFEGKTIINIDESAIRFSLNKNRAWAKTGSKNFSYDSQRYSEVSIIAGLSSANQAYFTVNKGKNCSKIVYYFILKVAQELHLQDPNWRDTHILMLDNASYHRSSYFYAKLMKLQIPVMFLGPYHFQLAPVERFFATIKKNGFSSQNTNDQGDSQLVANVKNCKEKKRDSQLIQIAQKILKTQIDWANSCFHKAIINALDDLALKDL